MPMAIVEHEHALANMCRTISRGHSSGRSNQQQLASKDLSPRSHASALLACIARANASKLPRASSHAHSPAARTERASVKPARVEKGRQRMHTHRFKMTECSKLGLPSAGHDDSRRRRSCCCTLLGGRTDGRTVRPSAPLALASFHRTPLLTRTRDPSRAHERLRVGDYPTTRERSVDTDEVARSATLVVLFLFLVVVWRYHA